MYPLVLIAGVVAEYVPNELCTADRYVTVFNIIASRPGRRKAFRRQRTKPENDGACLRLPFRGIYTFYPLSPVRLPSVPLVALAGYWSGPLTGLVPCVFVFADRADLVPGPLRPCAGKRLQGFLDLCSKSFILEINHDGDNHCHDNTSSDNNSCNCSCCLVCCKHKPPLLCYPRILFLSPKSTRITIPLTRRPRPPCSPVVSSVCHNAPSFFAALNLPRYLV